MIEFNFIIFLMSFRMEERSVLFMTIKGIPESMWLNWNTRIPLWVTNGSDSLGESFDFRPENLSVSNQNIFPQLSRGREGGEGSHDEPECLAEAWLGWAHSGFVHPFIHQLMDDWAWQAWQYHHPTISQSDTPRARHCNLITEWTGIFTMGFIKIFHWWKLTQFLPLCVSWIFLFTGKLI